MAMIVKMPNGDVEHFSDATSFYQAHDGALTIHDGTPRALAAFAPGGWWAVLLVPDLGPCAICGQRPENQRPRCRGKHVYIEADDTDQSAAA